jgi:transcriptional regulator with XRE-family HTH domain
MITARRLERNRCGIVRVVTSGTLIRQARLRRSLSQADLAERLGRDRAQIARWEHGVNNPSFETLREVLQVCGFDLSTRLIELDTSADEELRPRLEQTPQERVVAMIEEREGRTS